MTHLALGTLQTVGVQGRPWDHRNLLPLNQWANVALAMVVPWEPGVLWSSSRFCGGEMGGGILGADTGTSGDWGTWASYEAGHAGMKRIVGTTRDSAGSPLANAIVQLFLTATDAYVGETTSDTGGWFQVMTPFPSPAAHYIVAYKAGSPDIAGTSVNTLTAT